MINSSGSGFKSLQDLLIENSLCNGLKLLQEFFLIYFIIEAGSVFTVVE